MTFATTSAGTDVASGRKRLLVPVRIGPAVHADRDEACVAHEDWLVTEGAGAFQIEQLLLADCTRETPWPIETTIEGDVDRGGLTVPSNWYGTEVVSFDLLWPRFSGLHVAIADDHFTGASANPSADDHLEVWASPESDGYMSLTGERPKPERFRIRVADGRVFGVESTAAPPSVERAERPVHVVLRIRLPADAAKPHRNGIALAYVDADPGQPPAIVATGHAEVTTASSLGVARDVRNGVTCRIDGGALVRSVPAKGREQPLRGP